MKTQKALFLALAMTLTTLLHAGKTPVKDISKIISTQVFELLDHPTFAINEDLDAKVMITVNKNHEIVVLSVDATNDEFESYIKSRLNYNKITNVAPNRTYVVPVKLVRK